MPQASGFLDLHPTRCGDNVIGYGSCWTFQPRPVAPSPRRPAAGIVRPWMASSLAIGLGLMLVYAAVHKAVDPQDAHKLIEATLPALPAATLVRCAVAVEWALGLVLISGFRQRAAFLALLCLLAMFSGVLYRARLAGFSGSCGCLGLDQSASSALIRNAVLAGAGLLGYSLTKARVRLLSPLSQRSDS